MSEPAQGKPAAAASRKTRRIQTDLVIPRGTTNAPRPSDVTDPDYTPAETADGLEEVGGLEDWWDRPGHWGASKTYVGFGPRDKVTDPAMLEVLAKRALVEAIVMKRFDDRMIKPHEDLSPMSQARTARRSAKVEVVAGPDGNGAPVLKNEKDYHRVLTRLMREKSLEKEGANASDPLTPEKARQVIETSDASWKGLELRDPQLRFYV